MSNNTNDMPSSNTPHGVKPSRSRLTAWLMARVTSFAGIIIGGCIGWLYWTYAAGSVRYPLWFNVLTGAVIGGVILGSFRITIGGKGDTKK